MLTSLARSLTVILLSSVVSIELVKALPTLESAPELEAREGSVTVWNAPRDPSRCHELDVDDVESLPGYAKLVEYAQKKWGDDEWTMSINPPGYRDNRATICVVDPVVVNATGPADCTEERVYIPPIGRSNHIKVDQGYQNVGNWSITSKMITPNIRHPSKNPSPIDTTSAGHALFFSGLFQMPNITSESFMSITGKGDFINAPNNGFATVASNRTIKDTELTHVQDKRCIGTVMNRECILPANGRIRLLATGYIWFTYKTKRAPLDDPTGAKHRRYAVLLENVLLHESERSEFIDFEGYMNTTWRYDYFDECRWNFKLD
ncbi:hypothetical protein CVT24_005526 [Panaeolus cyanescens]|uniref:Ecp2 effector protein domain-containing protein n=1 Tax=Panaeolus cyanescens TaxID=181874 RepID=A0A409YBZ4_9AGAR|nr:hypothetical protein CVT24_005526 [Panaeolus cyanescens]